MVIAGSNHGVNFTSDGVLVADPISLVVYRLALEKAVCNCEVPIYWLSLLL